MTTNTQVAVVPVNLALPAHLQTGDIAAQIAAANAAASGGIKSGGFPQISIKGGKFHEKEGGELKTYMVAAAPGQPPLPMMCLEAVVIAANPGLSKTYFPGDYVEGEDNEPTCQSSNGIVPDAHVVNKQSPVCATCPQAQWGSKVSKMSGKDIKACDDLKWLVILPAGDLTYKALGMKITKSALSDWGKYVKALSDRGIPVNSVVTNITFDHTAAFPKILFAFNRFLEAPQYAQVQERAKGDDVKNIVSPTHPVAAPALPAPAQPAATQVAPSTPTGGTAINASVPPAPAPAAAPITGFGATAPAAPAAPAAPVAAEPAKRTRRTRAEIDAANAKAPGTPAPTNLSYLPEGVRQAVEAVGADSAAGQALLALYPRPAPAADLSYLPPAIKMALDAIGVDSAAGKALLAQYPAPNAAAPAPNAPEQVAPAAAAPAAATPAAAAPTTVGFGAVPVPAAPPAPPTAATTAAGQSLAAILAAKLGVPPPAAG